MAGIELANWNWKVVHRFVSERFGVSLHRLGFAFKRPKKPAPQGERNQTGGLHGGIRHPVGRAGAHWRQDILR